ncbi:type I-D CRISPR-associated protein Cas7/Csc2 [Lyngbya sp. CCY1209]|uniref:type I-D CRISPR-associated protein Cas7/Csc2 n=1 Tax=Lyngbya sp. CCY1209 TaxID=2886103 RepID=UPI002D20F68F|nr:type I-D CRISPR-associated protein Cas7/Csc2 [Lyngbya sp. CCY1209]MEB3887058.1 type I-D CRISPR-associated protein Cas7/Csc2 [Lyngbya sp. CCY1209]
MSLLEKIADELLGHFPRIASGNYIHFLVLRHSQSFPVFQTDGVLNTARTQAGLETRDNISRLVLFKRKQTTPERLSGRELLRSLNLTSDDPDAENYCQYNGENSCKKCPDCILYGFAIGDSGSERSKVYSDSAFSLTPYEQSHRSFTFNAPSEGGTMSEGGKMRTAINELDHVLPEVTFPTVESLRDSTYEGFIYMLGNLLRTRRYGAQESRTGTMKNHILGIIFADGEIFSNLYFTQALYDVFKSDLYAPIADIRGQASPVIDRLLQEEPVRISHQFMGSELDELLREVSAIYQDETRLTEVMSTLYEQTQTYAQMYGANSGTKKKGRK